MNHHHVVFFSGGLASFFAAKRVVDEFGADAVTLLFTDVLIEDEDLYRFLPEAAEHLGAHLEWIKEGRDPWTVFKDVRFLGNTRADPCSRLLKRELAKRFIKERFHEPELVTLYIGLDWSESERLAAPQRNWAPYNVVAPMLAAPYITKPQMISDCRALGIEPPRLYLMGAAHNNCGGFCVKAGQAQFAWLLRVMPDRYREHEEKEEAFREFIGKDVAILRDRRGGETKPLTMRALRERIEAGGQVDAFDIGGCGCFSDDE